MIVSNAAIDRNTTVFVLLALIFVAGIYSWMVLPRECLRRYMVMTVFRS